MLKYSGYILVTIAITSLLLGCATTPGEVKAGLDEEFSLRIGQTARITGEDLTISLQEVTEDSRCPRDVKCIWAGQASCIVRLTHNDSSYNMTLTEPGLSEQYTRESYNGYQLAFRVQPYPREGEKIPADDYQLLLIVSK
ncbi:MAG: hypothetical protein ABH839_03485 [Chloroflexota bacterium]